MIPNQWYAILESNEVKKGKLLGVTRMGEKLALWRDSQGQVTCMRDVCPHRGVALSAGKLIGDHVECPFHGFQFDPTGACVLIPANGRDSTPPKAMQAHTYPTREAHGFIWIWWGETSEDSLPPIRFFETLTEDFSYATIRDHWATHYSRAIENQLDVVHLPFVHRTTIGRGNRTLINGPYYECLCDVTDDNRLEVWVDNAVDRGQKPVTMKQMERPSYHPQLQFQFPNVWHNWIGDDVRVFVAFVPIDDANTMMYIRMYQRFMRVPILREIVNWLSKYPNFVIERQDKWVVETQQPKRSDLDIGETLIPGDGPIIAYRKRRRALINQS